MEGELEAEGSTLDLEALKSVVATVVWEAWVPVVPQVWAVA